jgi:hypothetical protein
MAADRAVRPAVSRAAPDSATARISPDAIGCRSLPIWIREMVKRLG